jgi:hypothetical protein
MRIPALTSALLVLVALAFAAIAAPVGADAAQACNGPNEYVRDDVWATYDDPTHPECGSLTDPCYEQDWSCGGCGPDVVEWVLGPIYCP